MNEPYHFNAPPNEILAIRIEFLPWRSVFYSRTREISIRSSASSVLLLSFHSSTFKKNPSLQRKTNVPFKIFCLDAFLFLIHHRFFIYVMRFTRKYTMEMRKLLHFSVFEFISSLKRFLRVRIIYHLINLYIFDNLWIFYIFLIFEIIGFRSLSINMNLKFIKMIIAVYFHTSQCLKWK